MPIQLTTPIPAGGLDPEAEEYTQAKLIDFRHQIAGDIGGMLLLVEVGNTVGGVWKPARPSKPKRYPIKGDDYNTMVTKLTSAADVPIYDEVSRELYQWLLDKGYYVGTIV